MLFLEANIRLSSPNTHCLSAHGREGTWLQPWREAGACGQSSLCNPSPWVWSLGLPVGTESTQVNLSQSGFLTCEVTMGHSEQPLQRGHVYLCWLGLFLREAEKSCLLPWLECEPCSAHSPCSVVCMVGIALFLFSPDSILRCSLRWPQITVILLPLPLLPACWDYKHGPPHLVPASLANRFCRCYISH